MQTAKGIEVLYEEVMKFYWEYINALEEYAKQLPDNEMELLQSISAHMDDVMQAMEHDIAVFDKAVSQDLEEVKSIQENLEVNKIRNQLQA